MDGINAMAGFFPEMNKRDVPNKSDSRKLLKVVNRNFKETLIKLNV